MWPHGLVIAHCHAIVCDRTVITACEGKMGEIQKNVDFCTSDPVNSSKWFGWAEIFTRGRKPPNASIEKISGP